MSSMGVTYSPAGPALPHPTTELLKARNIGYVRVQWVDLTNNIRYRILPLAYLDKILKSERPAIHLTKATLGLVFLSIADGFGATGEFAYVCDLNSIKICTYAPGHASIMGWFQEKYPPPGPNPSYDISLCPRTLLKRITGDAKTQSGIDFLVGFETEFILVDKKTHQPVNQHNWSCSPALYTGSVETVVLQEIADALVADGIELQMYHAEGAPGQYEIITGPLPPLQAADALIHTRETIYNIANKHGLRTTLSPRVFDDSAGSGTHVHISVHSSRPEGASWAWDGIELRPSEASFLAGVIDHLPSLCLFTLPFYASYNRVLDGIWSGGTYACWGVEHRETPIRLCNHTSPSSRNFEVKMMDGTSSPYLTLSGILGAGWAAGINIRKELTQKPITGTASAVQLSTEERDSLGIDRRLPSNLLQAQETFSKDQVLRDLLGNEFVDSYLSVNRAINERFDSPNTTAEAKRALLIEHY
ncbi:hypothetical protein H1R20_g2074, partial [Candolleomyces eurysporus]